MRKPMAKRPQILIVEDDALMAANMKGRVEGLGYGVIGPAETLEAAAEAVARTRPDAALLDFDVGGGASTELALSLVQAGVPVAFCTGHETLGGLPAALKRAPLLTKPVADEALETVLAKLLARA
jgi:DNA-binding NtrC family response regulator